MTTPLGLPKASSKPAEISNRFRTSGTDELSAERHHPSSGGVKRNGAIVAPEGAIACDHDQRALCLRPDHERVRLARYNRDIADDIKGDTKVNIHDELDSAVQWTNVLD